MEQTGWTHRPDETGGPPRPTGVRTVDELSSRLRALQSWSGFSYRELHRRVVAARRHRGVAEVPSYNTVYRCLQPQRSRLDVELVVDIAAALLPDQSLVAEWRQAHQVATGRAAGAAIVAVADTIRDDAGGFTGRAAEIARLLAAVAAGTRLLVIEGMAGVGKTRLANHLAHQLLARGYGTDLLLSVDLRGFDPEQPPADPGAVLDGFLRRLGVPGNQLHSLDLAGRVDRYQQLMADRNAIVVLDNAGSEDQLRPLLTTGGGCITIVSSRYRFGALPRSGRLGLEVFPPADSLALLRGLVGAPVEADPATAGQIADLVGHLPLALTVVAARIAESPGWTLTDHLERLTEHHERLQLDGSIGPALALSYEALPAELQRLLRLLALHPGRDIDEYATAALAGVDRAEVALKLAALVQANLVQVDAPGRYGLHDLVRLFATDRSRDDDRGAARRDALTRLFDNYRWTVVRAIGVYAPNEGQSRAPFIADPHTATPVFSTREQAKAWLDLERANLIAVARAAGELGWPEHTTDLSVLLHTYLDMSGYIREAQVLQESAVVYAADADSRARALNNLGCVHWRLGRYAEGRDCYQRALELARLTGNRLAVGRCLSNVALGHFRLGRYADTIECNRQVLEILAAEGGPLNSVSTTRGGLGWGLLRLGRAVEALAEFQQGLQDARAAGDSTFEEAYALANVAYAYQAVGRLDRAAEYGELSLDLSRRLSFRTGESDALNVLGRVSVATGDTARAISLHRPALELMQQTGNRAIAVEIRNDLGAALRQHGDPEAALQEHQLALSDAELLDDRYELARAHRGLADVLDQLGAKGRSRTHRKLALTAYTALGIPEAAEVRDIDPGRQ